MRAELTVATSKLETLRLRAKKEELSISQTDALLQTTLQEDAQKQSEAKLVGLGVVQSRLAKRENELDTMRDTQTKVACELE